MSLRSLNWSSRWLPPVVAAAWYLPVIAARVEERGTLWFVHVGRQMLHASQTSEVLSPMLGWESEVGYDGQYYFAMAVDPTHAASYMPDGVAGIVYSRPGYPALVWAAALGNPQWVPTALLGINVCAILVGTLALSTWLDRQGVPSSYALLYAFYPGVMYAVFRDLTEPLAYGLVAIAVLVFDPRSNRSLVATGGLLALAALTREPVVIFSVVAAGAIALPRSGRSIRHGWRALLFLGLAVGPVFLWKIVVSLAMRDTAQGGPAGVHDAVPFGGIVSHWPWSREHVLIVLAVILPTLVMMAASVLLLRHGDSSCWAVVVIANALFLVVFLPKDVYVDFGAASRASIGVVVASVCCIPAWRQLGRRSVSLAPLAWALPWYVVTATAVGLPAFDLVTL